MEKSFSPATLGLTIGVALAASAMVPLPVRAEDSSFIAPIAMPAKAAGFRRGDVSSYGAKGLGKSVRYQNRKIWADVFVYDKDETNLPDTYDAEVAQHELSVAWGVLKLSMEKGFYKDVKLLETFPVGEGPGRFDCFHAKIVNGEGTRLDSWACLTTRCNIYLKVRLSGPEGTKNPMRAFLKPWSKPACPRTAEVDFTAGSKG